MVQSEQLSPDPVGLKSNDSLPLACATPLRIRVRLLIDQHLLRQTPGALDSLALVLVEREPLHEVSAQEYAAITVGNCGANSEEGAKMIVRNQAVMQALVSCMSNAHDVRMQETAVVALKNCAASSQEAALGISQSDQTMALLKSFVLQTTHERLRDVAVGAINSISRSPAAVPKLKTTGVHSAMLQEMLSVEDSRPSGGTSDLRTLTAACAVINIEASQPELHLLQPWLKSAAGKRAIHNMVRCLGFALRGEQWKCVSFSPHSVICPLYNLTRCFALDDLSIDGVKVVQYIVQLIRECQRFSRWKDNLSVSIKILDNLALSAAFQALVRGQCIQLMQSIASTNSTHTSFWFPPHPSPEDQVCIQRIKVQAQKMAKALLALPLAVCMGQHARLGQSSVLLAVDEAILQMVVVYALY